MATHLESGREGLNMQAVRTALHNWPVSHIPSLNTRGTAQTRNSKERELEQENFQWFVFKCPLYSIALGQTMLLLKRKNKLFRSLLCYCSVEFPLGWEKRLLNFWVPALVWRPRETERQRERIKSWKLRVAKQPGKHPVYTSGKTTAITHIPYTLSFPLCSFLPLLAAIAPLSLHFFCCEARQTAWIPDQ